MVTLTPRDYIIYLRNFLIQCRNINFNKKLSMSQFYGLGSYTVNQLYSHARKFHEVYDSLLVVNILTVK